MLTARGWWFLLIVVFVLVIGAFVIPNYTAVPAILAVTLLAWFIWEWLQFHTKSNAAVSRLRVRRWVMQGGRDTPMLWANVPFEVRVRVRHDGFVTIDYAVVEDRLPTGADTLDGDTGHHTTIGVGEPADVIYTLKCPAPGVLRFEGVKVRVADLNGFFYRRVFLRDPIEFLVLPPLVERGGAAASRQAVQHRSRRPASTAYAARGPGTNCTTCATTSPGDPPKMIAWKTSARKDKLITKEYENDVPVRCVLFLDTSEGVRLGPPGNTLLTRMAGVAAVVAQAGAANRDLVGLTTFDTHAAQPMPPARTQTHMINVLRRLAEVAALQPGVKGVPPDELTRRAYPLAHELYPELMTKKTNTMPLGRLWSPLLDRWWGWLVLFVLLAPPCLLAWKLASVLDPEVVRLPAPINRVIVEWLAATFNAGVRITSRLAGREALGVRVVVFVLVWPAMLLVPSVLAGLFWFIYGFSGWFGIRAAETTRRKRLAALFSLQDGTGPDAIERYVHDDDAYAGRVAQFLEHHYLRCPIPLYDDQGRYRFRCPEKADVLAGAIVRAVSRARDNELYVVLADLAELGPDLDPLVQACRVARARRHHVMVIVPWPADVPSPDEVPEPPLTDDGFKRKKKKRHPDDFVPAERHKRLTKIVQANLTRQYHETFRAMRRALTGVGATVMRVNDGDAVRLVLDRLDRLRGMRSRR